jgi:hypothetical protein
MVNTQILRKTKYIHLKTNQIGMPQHLGVDIRIGNFNNISNSTYVATKSWSKDYKLWNLDLWSITLNATAMVGACLKISKI